jgi:neural Wiskott-Aldrich syndrome protein
MASDHPPPTYSLGSPDAGIVLESHGTSDVADRDDQLLIVPTVDAINFQKGYLGADGERAAIEGELQIKGTELERWTKVSVLLDNLQRITSL